MCLKWEAKKLFFLNLTIWAFGSTVDIYATNLHVGATKLRLESAWSQRKFASTRRKANLRVGN